MEHQPHTSPDMQPTTPEIPEAEHNYQLMTGHYRTDGSYKSDEQLRTEYVSLTDKLVNRMTNGVVVENPVTGETEKQRPDYVIWLDKSARPLAWLTKELWPTLAIDAEGVLPEMPQFKFVNIDKERWIKKVDPMSKDLIDVNLLDENVIRSLRSVFVDPLQKQGGLTEAIDAARSELDGKTLLVIDEVMSSGKTLDIAQELFKRAFPTAKVAAEYWMSGRVMRGTALANADLPVWYRQDTEKGRGVGPFNPARSSESPSLTQRLGGMFLSTAMPGEDPSSQRLRREIKWLGEDVRDGNVLVSPSVTRSDDDRIERMVRLNHMSPRELMAKLEEQNKRAKIRH